MKTGHSKVKSKKFCVEFVCVKCKKIYNQEHEERDLITIFKDYQSFVLATCNYCRTLHEIIVNM